MHAKLDLSLMCRCQRRHPRKRNWHSSSLTNYQTYEKQITCQQTSCLIKPSCIETNQYIREKAKHFQDGMFLYPDYGTSLWKANSSGTVRIVPITKLDQIPSLLTPKRSNKIPPLRVRARELASRAPFYGTSQYLAERGELSKVFDPAVHYGWMSTITT